MRPRPTTALSVNDNETGDRTRGDKRHPIHFAVEILRFSLPSGVSNRCGNRWGYHQEDEQDNSEFYPYAYTRMHGGLRIGDNNPTQQGSLSA